MVATGPSNIVLGAFLLLFGWLGYRRGSRAELATLVVTIGARLFLEARGPDLVKIINRMAVGFLFLVRGGFTSDNPSAVIASLRERGPLISDQAAPTFLLILFVGAVVLTYLLGSAKQLKSKSTLWSALLGAANGLVLKTIFLPLLPQATPAPLAPLSALALGGGLSSMDAALQPLRALADRYGSAVALPVVVLVVYLVVRSIQPEKKGG